VQMNGFPLAGRPLKVGRSERSASFPDIGEADKISALMAASSSGGADPLAAATAAASIIGSLPQMQDPLLGQSHCLSVCLCWPLVWTAVFPPVYLNTAVDPRSWLCSVAANHYGTADHITSRNCLCL